MNAHEEQRDGEPRRRRRRGAADAADGDARSPAGGEAPLHGEPVAHEAGDKTESEAFGEAEGEMPAGDDALAEEPQDDARFKTAKIVRKIVSRIAGEQGDRRRRRRGRRGGRRNRHERDRNGENGHDLQGRERAAAIRRIRSPPISKPNHTAEPDLTGAVSDLDAAPEEAGSPAPAVRSAVCSPQ